MKREIKFRGRDFLGRWHYGHLHLAAGSSSLMIQVDSFDSFGVLPETIGQYTGLKDKNGNKIYEGDILRGDKYPFNCDGIDNYFAEIVWSDDVCGFYRITIKNPNSTVSGISHGNWEPLDIDDIKFFEVIGNIHDNPELIEGGIE